MTLELGGKSPNLVFADADLEQAVDGSLFLIYANSGQVCDARSRIFVQDAVYDDFVARFVEQAQKIKVGDPTDEANHYGAVTSARQLEKIEYYVEIGQKEGATLACGGARIGDGPGLFYAPTAFVDVDNSMQIAQEEIFGPVACIGRFSDYDDGIQKANDTPYGLAATVWTSDLTTGHRAAHDIRAGGVWMNTSEFLFNESPFGGMKASGFGRELSDPRHGRLHGAEDVGVSLGGPHADVRARLTKGSATMAKIDGIDPVFLRGLTQRRLGRRDFLRGAGVGAGTLSLAAILAACSSDDSSAQPSGSAAAGTFDGDPAGQMNMANWSLYIDKAKDPETGRGHASLARRVHRRDGHRGELPRGDRQPRDVLRKAPARAGGRPGHGWDIMVITNGRCSTR